MTKFSSTKYAQNQFVSVIDLDQAQLDDDIEEEIDVVEDGLLSPTEENAINW